MIRHLLYIFIVSILLAACQERAVQVDALPFNDHSNGKWGLMAPDGEVIVPAHTWEREPTAVVNSIFSMPDEKGFYQLYTIEPTVRQISARRFTRIGHFFEKEVTLAQETPHSPILIIDRQGNTIASTAQYPQYDVVMAHNFCEGRALIVTSKEKYGYINTHGEIVVPPLYDVAYDFNEGIALVGLTNSLGETAYQFIDRKGKVTLSIQLSNCQLNTRMSNGLLMYKNLHTNQCCYLDKTGNTVICLPDNIIEAYTFKNEIAVFHTFDGAGLLNLRGEIVLPANYEEIRVVEKDRIIIRQEGNRRVADCSGNLIDDSLLLQPEYMVMDSIAWQEVPQVFIRQEKQVVAQPAEEAEKREVKTSSPTQPITKQALKQSVLRVDEWKAISRQNPFYEEASKVISGKLEETDADNRRMILNYVEHLRTSYTTKDIDFLEQLFSERALIIVGTVIHTGEKSEEGFLSPAQVVYNVKSKRQYLERLKQIFKANRKIDVQFSDFQIMRHPTQPGIYGVSLRQKYSSNIYSDDGYLFLLWDFRDKLAPQIHVRTWQPAMIDEHTALPEEEIFNIQNFNLQ